MKKAVEEKDMKKEVEKKSAKKAVEEKEVKKVADEKPAKKAAADKEVKKVADEKPAKKAAADKETKKVADEKPAKKAVAEKETKKAAEAKSAKKAAEEKEVKKPVEDKKAKKAVKEQEVVEEEIVEEDAEAITRPGIVEIYKGKEYKDKDGNVKEDFYFTFRSFHGYLIGRSQGYSTKDSCKNGVQAVMNACAAADVFDNAVKKPVKNYSPKFGNAMFEMYKDSEGKFRFRLFAKNAENVAASFGYKTKANLKSGIESLKRIATNYVLKDSTLKRKPADKA